jgi:hypothetical protein
MTNMMKKKMIMKCDDEHNDDAENYDDVIT